VRRCDLRDGTGDVKDGDAFRRLAEGCTGIVHLAAVSRVVWGERDPALCRATNVEGTWNVLAACRTHGVQPVVHVSSIVAVGSASAGVELTEDSAAHRPCLRIESRPLVRY